MVAVSLQLTWSWKVTSLTCAGYGWEHSGSPPHGFSPSARLDRLPFMVVTGQHSKRVESKSDKDS